MILIENCKNPQVVSVHTDFNIQLHPSLRAEIEKINGVEDLDTFSYNKYSFIVSFGKAFNISVIKKQILARLNEFVRDK